jgi:hypothetical protein
LSFFDDGEETAPQPSTRTPRSRASGGPPTGATRPRRPQPRRPQRAERSGGPDHRTLMVRRAVAAGAGVVILIVIVLVISGLKKSAKQESLKTYNHDVSQLAAESNEQVAHPLFVTLASAASKSALDVQEQVDQLRIKAQEIDSHAQSLSVPSEMEGAQRALLLTFGLRSEAMIKLAGLLPMALGGKAKASDAQIAGDMENFLASDVLYSQRVVPLLQQTLSANGIRGLTTTSSRFLPNIGWLEANTVKMRISGQATETTSAGVTGHHGSELTGVSVGTNALAEEPTLNHVSGGSSPTFTLHVENDGEFPETDVKVGVTVSAGGKQYKNTGTIEKTEPGKSIDAEVTVSKVPTGTAAKVEAYVEPVPGETNHEDTRHSYLAIFE